MAAVVGRAGGDRTAADETAHRHQSGIEDRHEEHEDREDECGQEGAVGLSEVQKGQGGEGVSEKMASCVSHEDPGRGEVEIQKAEAGTDRKSTRLNSSHV